jgi:ribonucleoside-diphosphate reductase alpha chain
LFQNYTLKEIILITKVTNRDGETEEFNIQKIKKMVARGVQGLDVNPLELESKVSVAFVDGVNTKHIHDSMIIECTNLTTPEEPDWRYVAGRFYTMGFLKEMVRKRGYSYDLLRTIQDNVDTGIYSKDLLENYTLQEITELNQNLDWDLDLIYDHAGAKALCDRYVLPNEMPQEMYMTIAMMLAPVVAKTTKADIDLVTLTTGIYRAIAEGQISLASPILLNLRRNNANLASCFIIQPDDNLEDIFDNIKKVALISKNAGGVGVNLDRIRARGSWIKHVLGASSGVVPMVKVLNDTAIYVDQEAKRAGAVTPSLSVWHLDVMDFLEIQTEAGDLRHKSFDVFPQLVVPDLFMERLDDKTSTWSFFDPYEIEQKYGKSLTDLTGSAFEEFYVFLEEEAKKGKITLTKSMRTRDVFKAIHNAWNVRAMPYITFKDTINRTNPNRDKGVIHAANLCQESFSNFDTKLSHTCNLCSLVLPKIESSFLSYYTHLAIAILDATIDLANPPIQSAEDHNKFYRTTGLGVLGMHDWLAINNLNYESEKGVMRAQNLMEDIAYHAVHASMQLARTSSPAPAYAGSTWEAGQILGRPLSEIMENSYAPERWKALAQKINMFGIRNTQLLAVAPNSSTALLQGVTPSILPTWDTMYVEATQLGTIVQLPYYIKERPLGYKAYRYHDHFKMNTFVAAMQKWVDSGISYDIPFDKNNPEQVTVPYMFRVYQDAWKKGIKTVYYIRWITEELVEGNNRAPDVPCISCAG